MDARTHARTHGCCCRQSRLTSPPTTHTHTAKRIFAIDTNPSKFDMARELGATDCINPADHDKPIQEVLVGMTTWGIDYVSD